MAYSIIKHKLIISRYNANQIIQWKQRWNERSIIALAILYDRPIERRWWAYSEIIVKKTDEKQEPEVRSERKRLQKTRVKDEWYLITFEKMTHASHSQPVEEWHHGFQHDYPTWMPCGTAGSKRIAMFGMNYSVAVTWFNGKYPAAVLSLSERKTPCVNYCTEKSFKHNDSWNSSSENAAKCQAFGKQQFGRGNEDTAEELYLCLSGVRWGGY